MIRGVLVRSSRAAACASVTRATFKTAKTAIAAIAAAVLFGAGCASAQAALPVAFPDAWAGQWSGTLTTIVPPDSVRNRIPITLEIAREPNAAAFRWRTVFAADTAKGLRDYRLLIKDAAHGAYAIDERNGLVLSATYLGGTLVSVYRVGDRMFESRHVVHGDTLMHDLVWWNADSARTERGSGANAEGGASVTSFRVEGRQHAVMTRRP